MSRGGILPYHMMHVMYLAPFPPPTEWQTDTCENITFPQLYFPQLRWRELTMRVRIWSSPWGVFIFRSRGKPSNSNLKTNFSMRSFHFWQWRGTGKPSEVFIFENRWGKPYNTNLVVHATFQSPVNCKSLIGRERQETCKNNLSGKYCNIFHITT